MTQGIVRLLTTALCLIFLGGCAEMTHLTRTRNLGDSRFILIDAKQRAISSVNNINCAEPSPDALSALAASQGANFGAPNGGSGAESFAIAEAAGSIGLRTQSIQLLRDSMFRVCEAYQNHQLSPFMVQLLHQRFQTTMVSVLAIEQLTGAMRAPAIVLGGSSSTGNADAIVKLSASREAQAASVEEAKKDLTAKTAEAEKAEQDVSSKRAALAAASDDQAKAAAQTALYQAQEKADAANGAKPEAVTTLASRNAGLAAIDRALTLAQASGSATANGMIESLAPQPASVLAVATAVKEIVQGTYALGHTGDFCSAVLADAARTDTMIDTKGRVFEECVKILASGQMLYAQ
ncbi:MAG: hypothetical protein ABIT68_08630 [Sphingomicrobium sp.]